MGLKASYSLPAVTCLFFVLAVHAFRPGSALTAEEDLEIERRLAAINKPSVKTIKTIYGEIIDCIDILKQPAFDHPLLKDHKIQRRPSHLPADGEMVAPDPSAQLDWLSGIFHDCPDETVPVRRTTREDLIREKLLGSSLAVNPDSTADPNDIMAVVKVTKSNTITGAKANINVQNPRVRVGEASGAQIWLSSSHEDTGFNMLSAGWLVDQHVYGDDRTHFSIRWVGDDDKGCFDVRCPGFVVTLKGATLGVVLSNISVYDGTQYEIILHIYQDAKTKNWWLAVGEASRVVGYWPVELFTSLTDNGAHDLYFGGYTRRVPSLPPPPMGSGVHPSDCYDKHTSYFLLAKYSTLADRDTLIAPKDEDVRTRLDCPGSYGVDYDCFIPRQDIEFAFLYGGPGGECKI